jgi:hypothetical protein
LQNFIDQYSDQIDDNISYDWSARFKFSADKTNNANEMR